MREKRTVKKSTRALNEDVKETMALKHDKEEREAEVQKMASSQLFSINASKNDKKREKLAKDRFKQSVQKQTSSVETLLVKRLREKNPPQKHADKDAEDMDVWGTPSTKGLNQIRFEAFKQKQMPKVKAVMKPLGGQSFNPSAAAHKGVLNKVYNEEKTEIEKQQALSLKNQNKMDHVERADGSSSSSEESDGEEKSYDSADSVNFGVPDRLKKKTKKDRKRQVIFYLFVSSHYLGGSQRENRAG